MTIQRVRLTVIEQEARRLDETLTARLPEVLGRHVSKAKARKLIMAGAVYLNGRPIRIASRMLAPGMTIEVHVDPEKLFEDATSQDKKFDLAVKDILFEDEDLLIVDKPPGLPSQPTIDENRDNLFAAVQRFLSKRDGTAKPYVGVHQRLDRDTSGVVLFTKSERVNAAVARLFEDHQFVKIYQALTAPPGPKIGRRLEKKWTIRNYLGRISSKSKPAKYGALTDGMFAETSFRLIEADPRGLWVEATPKTGRTHQIRVHLSEYGLPILGDDLYGNAQMAPRLMLHASEVRFRHPITGRQLSIKSPLPADFQQCLDQIRGIQTNSTKRHC